MRRSFKEYFFISLKGMGMGAADVVPGVSGGTIAFISGIYEELINSIKSVNLPALKLLFKEGLSSFWKAINGNFLITLFAGIIISVISLARILEYILVHHPILLWSFFFGLIVASAIFVTKKLNGWNTGVISALVVGTLLSYYITSVTPAETTEATWFVFIAGSLAICAMILPGISGSFILLLLGKYHFALNAVNEAKIDILLILIAGAAVGLIAFSNLLSWLLKKYYNLTIALLAGFMIGSLNKIWPWKQTITSYFDSHGIEKPLLEKNILPGTYAELTGQNPYLLYAVLLAFFGFFLIFAIEKIANSNTTK